MISVEDFHNKNPMPLFNPDWSLYIYTNMQDAWDFAEPDMFIWIATRKDVLSLKERQLFALWCCRQVLDLMKYDKDRIHVDMYEREMNGEATLEELQDAKDTAFYEYGARNNLHEACASLNNAYISSDYSARAYDYFNESNGLRITKNKNEAYQDMKKKQADYLRKNCKPNFNY